MAAKSARRGLTEEASRHLELAERFLEEGRTLADRHPVQAGEKLYKAAEEAVKALAHASNLSDVLKRVEERGRWTVTDLERVVRAAVKLLGKEVQDDWNSANYLHVWGFHEAKLDAEAVKARLPDVERLVGRVKKAIEIF